MIIPKLYVVRDEIAGDRRKITNDDEFIHFVSDLQLVVFVFEGASSTNPAGDSPPKVKGRDGLPLLIQTKFEHSHRLSFSSLQSPSSSSPSSSSPRDKNRQARMAESVATRDGLTCVITGTPADPNNPDIKFQCCHILPFHRRLRNFHYKWIENLKQEQPEEHALLSEWLKPTKVFCVSLGWLFGCFASKRYYLLDLPHDPYDPRLGLNLLWQFNKLIDSGLVWFQWEENDDGEHVTVQVENSVEGREQYHGKRILIPQTTKLQMQWPGKLVFKLHKIWSRYLRETGAWRKRKAEEQGQTEKRPKIGEMEEAEGEPQSTEAAAAPKTGNVYVTLPSGDGKCCDCRGPCATNQCGCKHRGVSCQDGCHHSLAKLLEDPKSKHKKCQNIPSLL